jgi:hypothetical protein
MQNHKTLNAKKIIKKLGPELKELPDIKIIPGNHNSFIVVRTCNKEIEYCKLFLSAAHLIDWIKIELESQWIYDFFPSDHTSSKEELNNQLSIEQTKQFINLQTKFNNKTNNLLK